MAVVSTGQITITDVNDYTYQGATAPKNPIPNVTVWIDTSVSPSVMKRWTGTAWEIVNEVVVGGRNLLLGSAFNDLSKFGVNVNVSIDTSNKILGNNSVKSIQSGLANDVWRGVWSSNIAVNNGEEFTLTVHSYTDNLSSFDNSAICEVIPFDSAGNRLSPNVIALDIKPTQNGKWEKKTISGKVQNANVSYIRITPYVTRNGRLWFGGIKFERGNKATDWTPAPEDVVADYTALINEEIADVKGEIAELETTVNGAFKDGIIQEAEAKAIEKYINSLNAEKSDIDNQYNTIYNDALLVDPTKQNLFNQKSSYNTAHSQLITSINTAIADGKTTTAEKADVDSKFTNYKNVLGGLSIRLTEALKAIEAKRIENIQIGGRNLILNSDLDSTILLYGVTATRENIVDNQLPSKNYFKFTNVVRTIGNYVFYIPTLTVNKFSQSLIGKKIQISFHIRSNNSQKLIFDRDGSQNFMIDSTWQKVRFNTVFNGGNLHFFIEGSGLTSFDISSVKIEFGDVATDWTPAPEDTIAAIDDATKNLIASSDVEYYSSTDANTPTGGSWQTTAPAWVNGRFVFTRTKVTKKDGTISYSPSTNGTNITGAQGAQGIQGIPGANGANGTTYYTWVKYADTPTSGMSDFPSGKAYLGIAYNKTTATESTNYSDYEWSLIKGADGIPGTNGTDGQTLYTWIKYADTATGVGMSDSPSGKLYIGIAVNKTTATESTTAADYTWSLIKGSDGQPGQGVSSFEEQYYLSTSNTEQTGGSWVSVPPAWVSGSYMWTRVKTNWVNPTATTYSEPVLNLLLTAQEQKVIDLENKTDFLTGTTINGNAIATGTLLVGNSNGTNAGITGIGDTSNGVYLWGGGTYQDMLEGKAKKEQRRNGIDIWRHPNGQIGFEIGIKDGRLIFNGYHSDGFKLFELDPNRGLIAVSYTQESWTQTPLRKLNYTSSTFNESTIASEIKSAITKKNTRTNFNNPGDEIIVDREYVNTTTYTLLENYVGYEYDNGTNPVNSSYESLKGMKANNNDRNTNIPNGWYMLSIGEVYSEYTWNSPPPPTYTFTVYVYYYQDGKITQTKVVTVTK